MRSRAFFLSFILLFVFFFSVLNTLGTAAAVLSAHRNSEVLYSCFSGFTDYLSSVLPWIPKVDTSLLSFFMVCWFFVSLLNTVTIAEIRSALRQVRKKKPFSEKCESALRRAAVIRLLVGLCRPSVMIWFFFREAAPILYRQYPDYLVPVTAGALLLIFILSLPHLAGYCLFGMLAEVSCYGAELQPEPLPAAPSVSAVASDSAL